MKLAYTLAELAALGGGGSALLGGAAGYKKGKETGRPVSGAVRGALGAGTGFLAGATGGMFAVPGGHIYGVAPAGALGALAGYKGLTAGMNKSHEKKAQVSGLFDELEKLGAVSPEQARRALDQLDNLEQNKPDAKQVVRYGLTGAAAGAGLNALGNVIAKKPGAGFRGVAADAVKGALGAGALPLVQSHLDRRAQMGTLRQYVQQPAPPEV